MSDIRTRFAPSPTGHLHIGSVRTALFSYLYAHSQGGTFLLRIEDTDRERSKPEFTKAIFEDLAWLGLMYDKEVVRQSERIKIYKEHANRLIKEGKASRPDPATEAVTFSVPKKKIVVHDIVHGDVEFDTELFDDIVIMKSDGTPTYSFACVVDDHAQAITHVIRGDDHLSNTPRQWLLYEALGFKPPKVAHIPLITGADHAPLSKRHSHVALNYYRAQGYLPEAVLNYLALLGWSPGGNQEFILLDEMKKKFRLKAVGKTNAAFDEQKLAWLNGQHLKALSADDYLARFRRFVEEEKGFELGVDMAYACSVALLFQSRIRVYKDLAVLATYCFQDKIAYNAGAAAKYLTPEAKGRLMRYHEALSGLRDFNDKAALEDKLRNLAEGEGVTAAEWIHPTRVALTGNTVSPSLFALMKVLGKAKVLERLERAGHFNQEVGG